LRDQAEAMGMSYQELADTAVKSARRAAVFSELEFVGDMSENDKELIASMAKIGEGGTAQVKIPGIEEMVDVANVTDEQMELLRKEGMSDTDIYKQQLTVAEKSEQGLARIEAAARVQIRLMGGKSTDVDAQTASQMLASTIPTTNQISPTQQKEFEKRTTEIENLENKKGRTSKDDDLLEKLKKEQESERNKVINSFSGKFKETVTDMFANATQLNDAIISPDGEVRKTKAGDFIVTGTQMDSGQGINALESALTGSQGGGGGGQTLQVGGTITVQGDGASAKVDVKTFMDVFSKLPSGNKQDMFSQLKSV